MCCIAVQSCVATRYLPMQNGRGDCLDHPAWQAPDQVVKMSGSGEVPVNPLSHFSLSSTPLILPPPPFLPSLPPLTPPPLPFPSSLHPSSPPPPLPPYTGGNIASSWAVLNSMGQEGYMDVAKRLMEVTEHLKEGVNSIQVINPLSLAFPPIVCLSSLPSLPPPSNPLSLHLTLPPAISPFSLPSSIHPFFPPLFSLTTPTNFTHFN